MVVADRAEEARRAARGTTIPRPLRMLRQRPLTLQWLVLGSAAALLRISVAVSDHGMLWPDEIYQTTEQAHRLAFGYGFRPWEFAEGLRSWLLPGALSLVMRSAAALGASSGLALMTTVKLLLALLGVAAVGAGMLLAWRLGGPTASLLAGGLAVAFPMLLVYGPHPFAETVSACLVVLASALALGRRPASHRAAGVVAGLTAVIRPQNGIVALGILLMLLARPDRRPARRYLVGAGVVALLAGLLDWWTWGTPFASFWRYIDFNVVDGGAGAFGTASWRYYLQHLLSANGPLVLVVLAGLVMAARRAPWLIATVASYVVLHSVVGHKELRFVLPVIPLALALAGAGLGEILDRTLASRGGLGRERHGEMRPAWTRPAVLALVALLTAAFTYSAGRETLGRLGEARPELSDTSPWHLVESWNRLLSAAGGQPSLCGLAVVPLNVAFTGGYSYLHRDVPLFNADWMAARNGQGPPPSANGLIAPDDYPVPAGFREVSRVGGTRLLMRAGGCSAPSLRYSRDLPLPPALLSLWEPRGSGSTADPDRRRRHRREAGRPRP